MEADRQQYENDPSTYEIYTSYYGEKPYFVPEGFRGITHILLSVDEDLLKTYQDLQSRFEEQAEPEENTGSTEGAEPEETEEPEEPVTEEQVEQARLAVIASVQDTIDEIYAKLDAGTPWLDLVDEYSTDPGMKQESNRTNGYSVFADSLMYDSAFVQASFSVDEIGDVSQPYVGMYGIYIVHYTRDVPSGPIELTDEIRATLENELLSEARNTLMNNALETWILNTIIEYTEEGEAYKPSLSVEPDDTEAIISDEGAAIEEIGE